MISKDRYIGYLLEKEDRFGMVLWDDLLEACINDGYLTREQVEKMPFLEYKIRQDFILNHYLQNNKNVRSAFDAYLNAARQTDFALLMEYKRG